MKLKFINFAAIIAFTFAFIQQLIVALSTVMIAKLSQAVVKGEGYLLWLILFIISLIIVYIPTTLTNLFSNRAKYLTYCDFIRQFSKIALNHPEEYSSSGFREEKEAYFTHEAWIVIQDNYNFFLDMFSLVFNVGLNILVLCLYLDFAFLLSYLCAIPLTLLCIFLSKGLLQKLSDESQKSRKEMMQTLSSGWDSILVGNALNTNIWKDNFFTKCKTSENTQRSLILGIDITSTMTLVLCSLPIFLTLFMYYNRSAANLELLSVLVATTPRQITTIQNLSDMIGLSVKLNEKIMKIKQISLQLDFMNLACSKGTISWDRIHAKSLSQNITLHSMNDLKMATNDFAKGRYSIVGNNGTGKSTLLAGIKSMLGDKAYFLPSQSKMMFSNELNHLEYSAGEKKMANLQEISLNIKPTEVSVLLLDEWNNNLDYENFNKANALIDELSTNFCVIEVLHKF